jgi:hypothetical protein
VRARLAYLHFPKAAGTSVRAALGAYYPAEATVPWSFDRVLFGGFDRLDEVREPVFLGGPHELQGYDYMEGHWSLPTILAAFDPADVVCVVREPRARLLSHYTFWRSWPQWMHDLWAPYDAAAFAQRRLSEFLSDPRAAHQADNLCTRLLLGEHPLAPPDGFLRDPEAAAAAACARVDALGYADVLERGADMYAGLEAWFGSPLSRERLNETDLTDGEPVDIADFTDRATLELLQARTAADRVLWQHVAERRGLQVAAAADLADSVFAATFGRIIAEHAAPASPTGDPAESQPSPADTVARTQPVPAAAVKAVRLLRRGPKAWIARGRAEVARRRRTVG